MTTPHDALLDQPPLRADELAAVEDAVREVLGTAQDVVVPQAEAILALEAVARSAAGPGSTALNIVTGPYGRLFGGWLRESGARVEDLETDFDRVVSVAEAVAAIERTGPDLVAIVHAEAATGGVNPVAPILAAARGALTVVDAVASVGAEPVPVAEWGADITVIGPQKGLAGPAGVSAVAVSERAWERIEANPRAPRRSSLSLLDWRDDWLRAGRAAIPGTPSRLETRAFAAALRRALAEGLPVSIARHRAAAAATVAGAEALGLEPWLADPAARAAVDTTLRITDGRLTAERLAAAGGGILSPGDGALRGRLLRVNHTGRAAALDPVLDALRRLAAALGRDPGAALDAARAAWGTSAPLGG